MINDRTIMKAVSSILKRSERQQDQSKIINTFVDVGILPQINNMNNQIVYGRRGTGKTHIFKYLASQLTKTDNVISVYIDARTLGSTSQFTDNEIPMQMRCVSLFRDILGEIHNSLLEYIIENPTSQAERALDILDDLSKVATEPVKKYTQEILETREIEKQDKATSAGINVDTKGNLGIKGDYNKGKASEKESKSSFRVSQEDKVIFPELYSLLDDFLESAEANLYILLDEWSSLPFDIQPYLAEFFKRSFISNPKIITKIASLEYRSNFGISLKRDILGFEFGGEISTALDIDDYYVYDRNPEFVTSIFSKILYKHLKSELPNDYLNNEYNINSGERLSSRLFTSKNTFEELVRAAEGVARDLINIFVTAFFDSKRKGRSTIYKKSIIESARQWFEKDKSENLDSYLEKVLRRIVDEVIGKKKARSFLLPRELEKHQTIHKLFDSRVLHLMQRGYADKDNPGVRYNIYTLDYGTYVDLINTSRQPQLKLEFAEKMADEVVVPFDDKRSIRRIVLTSDILNS